MQVQINPEQVYNIELTGAELMTVQAALMEIPAKFANPLTAKIADQVQPKKTEPLKIKK